MDAKEYLERVEKNERIIANKLIEREYWIELAKSTTVGIGGDRVQSSGTKQKMESNVVEANMIDSEIARLRAEIADIIRTIQRLKANEYDVLFKRYVQHMELKEIPEAYSMSYSWVKKTHNDGIKNLQMLLDKGAE